MVKFATPRKLPRASELDGRVVVLDLAFAGSGLGRSFKKSTGKLIRNLGDRLAIWVDHHDHALHHRFDDDPRFRLATKAEHSSCPEMIDPELVEMVGPVDTVVCHADLDGLYAAVKWLLGGVTPYEGADDDARAIDTRMGEPSRVAAKIDRALRGRPKDEGLRSAVVHFLVGGCSPGVDEQRIEEAAREFDAMEREAMELASRYEINGRVAVVEVEERAAPYDKTDLLLEGQKLAPVAVVKQGPHITAAAAFDSGWNLVELMGLGGGMPTRVSFRSSRLDELIAKVNEAELPKGPAPGEAGETNQ